MIKLKKQGKSTKYVLRLIPLGGFVSMMGEEERSDEEGSFSKSSIPKRIAIVMAGGLVNIIFALITYIILMTVVLGDFGTALSYTGKFPAPQSGLYRFPDSMPRWYI